MFLWDWANAHQFLVGLLLGVMAIFVTLLIALWQKQRVKIVYFRREFSVVGETEGKFPTQVQILFEGALVPRITSSRLVFWNGGNKTLMKSDLLSTDPLRVVLPAGEQILDAKIVTSSREVNGVSLERRSDNVEIHFDILEKREGFSIDLVHSAPRATLGVRGTIVGSAKGLTYTQRGTSQRMKWWDRVPVIMTLLLTGFVFFDASAALLGLPSVGKKFDNPDEFIKDAVFFLMTAAMFVFSSFIMWRWTAPFSSSLDPNGE